MKNTLLAYILSLSAAVLFLTGCEKETIVPDDTVSYKYLYGCIWLPADHADSSLPFAGRVLYFHESGNMATLSENSEQYFFDDQYSCRIETGSHFIALRSGRSDHLFKIDRLCETHITLFYQNDPGKYIVCRRVPFPDEQVDKGSFPGGWF